MNQPKILHEGELIEHPVARLLNYLYDQEQTGRLVLFQEGVDKTVFIIQGLPAYAESSLRDETLGRYLVKTGQITEEDFEASLNLMMSEGLQQGAALVKLGKLRPKELYQVMKSQTLYKIATAFSFQEGPYRFYSDTEFIARILRFEFAFHAVLKEGVFQFMPEETLDRELNRLGAGPLSPRAEFSARLAPFNLSEPEREFAGLMDENRSLSDLINFEPAYPFARRLVYLFALCGLIGVHGKLAGALRELVPGEEEFTARSEGIYISPDAPEAVVEEIAEEPKESPDKIAEFYIELKRMNCLEQLGISAEAGDAQVEEAYRKRLEEFDRNRFSARLDPELEAKLEEINTGIISAYEALRNQDRRDQYLQGLREKEEADKVSVGLEAEKFLQEGLKLVRGRDWGKAQKMFEQAVSLRPSEPEYYGYLGWSIYCNPELKLEERRELAKEKIRHAIKMNPNVDSIHVFLGKIYKDEGKKLPSVHEFKEALRCNPNCREARRELEAQGVKA